MAFERFYGIEYEPGIFSPNGVFCGDLLLFSRLPQEGFSIVGGRSAHGYAIPGGDLCAVLGLKSAELSLIEKALSSQVLSIVNVARRPAAVFGRFYRACGLGVICLFDYSAKVSLSPALREIFPSFSFFPEVPGENHPDALGFAGAVSDFAKHLFIADGSAAASESDLLLASARLSGCRAGFDGIPASSGADRLLLGAFSICFFSAIRRLADDRSATVSFENGTLYFGFGRKDEISRSELSEMLFCDRLARRLGIPFGFEFAHGVGRIFLLPRKVDPSLYSLKSGVFVDGEPVV